MAVDYVYRLEQPHVQGQLALVCQTIADASGLIGDLVTIQVGSDRSLREISVEVRDHGQAEHVAAMLGRLDGVRVIPYYDRAMRAHEGASSTSRPACRSPAGSTRRSTRLRRSPPAPHLPPTAPR